MTTFNFDLWTRAAMHYWTQWWSDRLQRCGLNKAEFASATRMGDEDLRAWANTAMGFLKGNQIELKRVFCPTRKTKQAPNDRLAKIAAATTVAGEAPLTVSDLWAALGAAVSQRDTAPAAPNPWHPAFPQVPHDRIEVAAALPPVIGRSDVEAIGTVEEWAKALLSRRFGGGAWLWVVGRPGSGRKHVARQLVESVRVIDPKIDVMVETAEPIAGWERFRSTNPNAVVVAVAHRRPESSRKDHQADQELYPKMWGHVELAAAAQQLQSGGFISNDQHTLLAKFAERVKHDSELLGPDKRPAAVVQVAAEVLGGAIVDSPRSVRANLRQVTWSGILGRLPQGHFCRPAIGRLLALFWSERIASSAQSDWRRVPRDEAIRLMSVAMERCWPDEMLQSVDALAQALSQERLGSKERKDLAQRLQLVVRKDGAALLEDFLTCSALARDGEFVTSPEPAGALLAATAILPTTLAPVVLADPDNSEIACEWALSGHDPMTVAGLLASVPTHVRPFSSMWLLAFAWAARQGLSSKWVARYLQNEWATALLATIYGFGDPDSYSVWSGRRHGDAAISLLQNASLHWSGQLVDLNPANPQSDLERHLPASCRVLLRQWLALRERVWRADTAWYRAQDWLPRILATVAAHSRGEVAALDDADQGTTNADGPTAAKPVEIDLNRLTAEALWWLAPGQLLGLANGEIQDERRPFSLKLAERIDCQVRRAESGDVAAQDWLAGEHLAVDEAREWPIVVRAKPGEDALDTWTRAPAENRLRWLLDRATGRPRELAVLIALLSWQFSDQPFDGSKHRAVVFGILDRQPRPRLHELVRNIALPWARGRPAIEVFDNNWGLKLAEHCRFADILTEALEAPQRWLAPQRAVRVRGEVVLEITDKARRDQHWWCYRLESGAATWGRFAAADAFAHAAAVALHRLGQPEALRQRWAALPEWALPAELDADLQALAQHAPPQYVERVWHGEKPLDAEQLLAGRAWLEEQGEFIRTNGTPLALFGRQNKLERPDLEGEFKELLDLAVVKGRFDVAAANSHWHHHARLKDFDPSGHFWTCASRPREHDLDVDQRHAPILQHAIWLWTRPPLPGPLADWLASLKEGEREFTPGYLRRKSVAPWDRNNELVQLALDRASRAAVALSELGDATPLVDWVAHISHRDDDDDNWFQASKLHAQGKRITESAALGTHAWQLALQMPDSRGKGEGGLTVAEHVLDNLSPRWASPPQPLADWVLDAVLAAPTATVWRFIHHRSNEDLKDRRFLPLLRQLHRDVTSVAQRTWLAQHIECLEPNDTGLLDAVSAWLATASEPFAGPEKLIDAATRHPIPLGGFSDLLVAAKRLWLAGRLDVNTLHDGLLRLALRFPPDVPLTDDDSFGLYDEPQAGDDSDRLAAFFRRRDRERMLALRQIPQRLVDLAIELGDQALAERVCVVLGKHGAKQLGRVRSHFVDDDDLARPLQLLDRNEPLTSNVALETELSAMRLALRHAHTDDVRRYANERWDRQLAEGAADRDIAYMLMMFQYLGPADWDAAVGRIPADRVAAVLVEGLAQGFTRGMSDSALQHVLAACATPEAPT